MLPVLLVCMTVFGSIPLRRGADPAGSVQWSWPLPVGLDSGFVATVSTGLLAVIATIGVAFALPPSLSDNETSSASVWTWHRLGTVVARGSAVVALLMGLFLVLTPDATASTDIERAAWLPGAASLAVGLLAVVLAGAIASWQDSTGYGRWASSRERSKSILRLARAHAYLHRESDKMTWPRLIGSLVLWAAIPVAAVAVTTTLELWSVSTAEK